MKVRTIRRRAAEAAAAVQGLREQRRSNAIRELRGIFETAYGGFALLQVLHGRDDVVREFDLHFGGMQDDRVRDAVAHRLLTNGGRIGDAQAFLQRLHRLRLAAMAVSAGAGPEPGRGMLSRSADDPGSETVEGTRSESAEDGAGDAETDDTESVFDEGELERLRERLGRLGGEAESSEGTRPAAGVQQSQGSAGASDEGGSSRRGVDRYAQSGDVAVGGGSGSVSGSGGSGAEGSGGGVRDGGWGRRLGRRSRRRGSPIRREWVRRALVRWLSRAIMRRMLGKVARVVRRVRWMWIVRNRRSVWWSYTWVWRVVGLRWRMRSGCIIRSGVSVGSVRGGCVVMGSVWSILPG